MIALIALLISGCLSSPLEQTTMVEQELTNALEISKQQLGRPYVWGGRGPDIFDCSGLITYSYKQAVGRNDIFKVGEYQTTDATMDDLYRYNVILLPLELIKPGDIVFITREEDRITHGGLFNRWIKKYEEMEIIHSSSYSNSDLRIEAGVRFENWPVQGVHRGQRLVAAGRLKLQ